MGSKTQQQSSTTSSTTPVALSQLQDIYSRINSAASQPYTPYTGEITAGLTDQQKLGISNINTAAGSAQPYYGTAANYATQAGAPISAAAIQNYQNPYTQSVIDATQAQFNELNGQQQQQALGNAASQGALGGDRSAVLQGILAGQQQMAQAPVLANLRSQGYTQALNAAQADRTAAGNAASLYGNLGTAAQNAALSGAAAQVGAGTLEQQTNQAADTAAYQQFLQQQAFPYQQAQFLASLGLPVASAMGSSSSGTQSTETNPWGQILGLGTAALMAFSDERVKEDAEPIGKTFDGQNIYRFRYKGSPRVEIGLMAQEVEKKHPYAVGETGGIKTVNYDDATARAAAKRHFASGGTVLSDTPNFMNAQGYVPIVSMGPVTPLTSAPAASMSSQGSSGPSANSLGTMLGQAAKQGLSGFGSGTPMNITPFSFDSIGTSLGSVAGTGLPGFGGLYEKGGFVETVKGIRNELRKARGGVVETEQDSNGVYVPKFADGGPTFDDRFGYEFQAPVFDAPATAPTQDDQGPIIPDPGLQQVSPQAMQEWRSGVDQPNPALLADAGVKAPVAPPTAAEAPSVAPAPSNPMRVALPQQITNPDGVEPQTQLPANAMAFNQPQRSPFVLSPQNSAIPQPGQPQESQFGRFNPFGLSDKARQAIIAGGLAMAASKNPNILGAIGEGGLYGLSAYGAANKDEREAAEKKITQQQQQQRIDLEAKRIAQDAEQFAKNYGLAERRVEISEDKTPEGYRRKKDGTLEPEKGGPADPAQVEALAKAKRPVGAVMDPDTADFLAERVLVGDTRALVGLGRGAQGAENIAMIQSLVAQKARERGIDPTDILAKVAEQSGNMASQRTFGTNVARMAVNSTEAQGAIELGRQASAAVPRTNWVPVNKAIQAYQSGTSDPALAKFGAANLAIINTYARAISPTGVPTVNDKQHAEHLLSTAMGPEAYNAVLDQMNEEIKIAHAAPLKAKKEMEDIRKGRVSAESHTPAKTAPVATIPPPSERKVGTVYQTPKGPAKWTGKGWVLAQ